MASGEENFRLERKTRVVVDADHTRGEEDAPVGQHSSSRQCSMASDVKSPLQEIICFLEVTCAH